MLLKLAVVHFAGELQHSGLVSLHPDVDHGAGVSRRRALVLGVHFQQEPLVAAVVAERFSEHQRRGPAGVHHQREPGLRLGRGDQVPDVRVGRERFVRVQSSYPLHHGGALNRKQRCYLFSMTTTIIIII